MFKKRWAWILLFCLLALLTALLSWLWQRNSTSIPSDPEQMTLFSIDGTDHTYDKEPETAEKYHGYPLLGKVDIADEQLRREIAKSLQIGVSQHANTNYACYWPRHAIRIVSKGKTIEYDICFQCEKIYVYEGHKWTKTLGTSSYGCDLLNSLLRRNGIALAPPPIDPLK